MSKNIGQEHSKSLDAGPPRLQTEKIAKVINRWNMIWNLDCLQYY